VKFDPSSFMSHAPEIYWFWIMSIVMLVLLFIIINIRYGIG